MLFVWDRAKAGANIERHGISFEEASTVFLDPLSVTIPDPDHGIGEERWLVVGQSAAGRILVVSHLDERDTIRIIGARAATRRERMDCEEDEGLGR